MRTTAIKHFYDVAKMSFQTKNLEVTGEMREFLFYHCHCNCADVCDKPKFIRLSRFWRPIHFSELCRLLLDQFRPSVWNIHDPEHCESAKMVWGAYRKSYLGFSGDPSPTPYEHPFPQTGGWQPPVKTCIANCGQTTIDTRMVCIDSL